MIESVGDGHPRRDTQTRPAVPGPTLPPQLTPKPGSAGEDVPMSKVIRGDDAEQRGGYLSGPKPQTGTPPKPPLFTTKPAKETSTTSEQSSQGTDEIDAICDAVRYAKIVAAVINDDPDPFDCDDDEAEFRHVEADRVLIALCKAGLLNERVAPGMEMILDTAEREAAEAAAQPTWSNP